MRVSPRELREGPVEDYDRGLIHMNATRGAERQRYEESRKRSA